MSNEPDGHEDDEQTGSALRNKLESTLQENKTLAAQLGELKAKDVLREQGLDLVKVDDLKDIPVDEIETRAQSLQEERSAAQRDLVKTALQRQGVKDDELEDAVTAFLSGKAEAGKVPDNVDQLHDLSRISGTPVTTPPSQLHGFDAIQTALSKP